MNDVIFEVIKASNMQIVNVNLDGALKRRADGGYVSVFKEFIEQKQLPKFGCV